MAFLNTFGPLLFQDYYTVHGEDAVFVAKELYKTTAAIKYLGSGKKRLTHSSLGDVIWAHWGLNKIGQHLADIFICILHEWKLFQFWFNLSWVFILAFDECHMSRLLMNNITSGNGLVLSGIKPLFKQVLINFYDRYESNLLFEKYVK